MTLPAALRVLAGISDEGAVTVGPDEAHHIHLVRR